MNAQAYPSPRQQLLLQSDGLEKISQPTDQTSVCAEPFAAVGTAAGRMYISSNTASA
jgi:hypothetical protein